ncbi:MAG: DUF2513 domain-containing protein [Chthoniobacteraceae bacterium]
MRKAPFWTSRTTGLNLLAAAPPPVMGEAMKRDMELVRLLLLRVEQGEVPAALGSYPEEEIVYNSALMIEAGLIKGRTVYDAAVGQVTGTIMERLTWEGHDFLDAARNETVWNKAKEKVLKPGISWTFSILLEYLKAEARAQMQKHGLLPPT